MELPITYTEVKKRYPKHVAEVIASLRKGTSKNKNAVPNKLKWKFYWGVRIGGLVNGHDFLDMLAGQTAPPKPKVLTEDQHVADYASRASISLVGTIGGHRYSSYLGKSSATLPKEIEDSVRAAFRKEQTETARINKLTPQELDAETQQALKELRGMGGFMEFRVGR